MSIIEIFDKDTDALLHINKLININKKGIFLFKLLQYIASNKEKKYKHI